jgi:hypothetical protein
MRFIAQASLQSALRRLSRRSRLMLENLERRDCPAAVLGLSLSQPVIFEGERVDVTLTLSERAPTTQRVNVTTVAGSATYGVDYFCPLNQQVTFSPGQTRQTISIRALRDAPRDRVEGTEYFTIVATPVTAGLGVRSATVGIADYAPPPSLLIRDVAVTEGNSGTTPATFTVRLSKPFAKAVSVNYATRDGSATVADADYVAAAGSLIFAPGETSKTVTVSVNGDNNAENNETFSLVLSSPVNATIGLGMGTCTIVNDETDQPGFQITLVYVGTVTPSQRAAFEAAANRWSQVITGDLPGVTVGGTFIDDLRIEASVVAIDGPGGVLGQAGPTAFRPVGGLPYTGRMQFDTADVASMESGGQLQSVIMHEMGHVLGIGTLWSSNGLLNGEGTANPVYVGANAVREYNTIFGVTGTSVPVENTGGPGTQDSHWRESTMRTELMTGYAEFPGVPMPLSRITVGSLADMNYIVNYAAADAYSAPPLMAPVVQPTGRLLALPVMLPPLLTAGTIPSGGKTPPRPATVQSAANTPPSAALINAAASLSTSPTSRTSVVSPTARGQAWNSFAALR